MVKNNNMRKYKDVVKTVCTLFLLFLIVLLTSVVWMPMIQVINLNTINLRIFNMFNKNEMKFRNCVVFYNFTQLQQCIITRDTFYISPNDIDEHTRLNGNPIKNIETDNIIGWNGSNPHFKELLKMSYIKKQLSVIYLKNNQTFKYFISDKYFISSAGIKYIYHQFQGIKTIDCYYDGRNIPKLSLDELCLVEIKFDYTKISVVFLSILALIFCTLVR